MKKISVLFLSVVAMATTLVSCNKDEAAPSIVAKWQFSTMEGTYGTQTFAAGTPEALWSDTSCTTSTAYWKFDQGTALHYVVYQSSNNCEEQTVSVTYSVDSKNTTLSVTTPNGTVQYPIVKLTATELAWREQGSGQDSSGATQTYNVVHHMVKK
jgi:hypothetical protein